MIAQKEIVILKTPDKQGYWLAFDKENEIPIILEFILEENELSNFFGMKIDKNSNEYLVPYVNNRATSVDKYKSYIFIKDF